MKVSTLDIGCGSNKAPGSTGLDIFQYEGVDIVHDVNTYPWPIDSDTYSKVVCQHVIEHIDNVVKFMAEIHRICKDEAEVEITTPHFSSINSWADPTHKAHFSLQWYKVFTEGYLVPQAGQFALINSKVEFGKSLGSRWGELIYKIRGPEKWEKNSAFRYPGMDLLTSLRVVKKGLS